MTGLSGSGKTTIAVALERILHSEGRLTQVLDGDNMRTGINSNLGFTEADRTENIRRIAEVAKLFSNCGIITICCFVSPTIAMRQQARTSSVRMISLKFSSTRPLKYASSGMLKGFTKSTSRRDQEFHRSGCSF
jgi:adenylylsulfate kinase-like enzyme